MVFVIICLIVGIGSIVMGIFVNLFVVLVLVMGLNVFFVFVVVGVMGIFW